MRLYTPAWWRVAVASLLLAGAATVGALGVLAAPLLGWGFPGALPAAAAAVVLLGVLAVPLLIVAPRPGPLTFARRQWVALAPLAGVVALLSAVPLAVHAAGHLGQHHLYLQPRRNGEAGSASTLNLPAWLHR